MGVTYKPHTVDAGTLGAANSRSISALNFSRRWRRNWAACSLYSSPSMEICFEESVLTLYILRDSRLKNNANAHTTYLQGGRPAESPS